MNKLDCSFNHLGIVEAIGDGIVSIKGLTNVANGEKKQEEVLSSDDVKFQLMSLPPIHTSAFIILLSRSTALSQATLQSPNLITAWSKE